MVERPQGAAVTVPADDVLSVPDAAEVGEGESGSRGTSRLRRRADRVGRHPAALRAAIAFLAYVIGSIVLWGLPVLMHLSTRYQAMDRELGDPDYYRWALGWTPWALMHGRSPLSTDLVFAPNGTSLTWSASIPGPALLAWPVTRVFGALVSYNVWMLLAPALAAWATYLLCNRLTRSFWPSFAGGILFGLSAYMTGQMHHNLNLVLIFPVPLIAYLIVRSVEGSIGGGAFVGSTALALLGLFLTSTELFATTAFFGAIAFVFAFLAARDDRRKILRVAGLTALSYGIAAIVLIPYLVEAFQHVPRNTVRNLVGTSVDLLGFIVPRNTTLVGGSTFAHVTDRFTASVTSDASYMSVAGLAILIGFTITERRRRGTIALVAFILLTALLALGPVLRIAGSRQVAGLHSIPLPGGILESLPLIRNAVPERFPAYAELALAVAAALWLARAASRGAWVRWAIVVTTAVLLLPDVSTPPWHFEDRTPAFFTDGTFASVLRPDENVFVISGSKGEGMAWQEVSDYAFAMSDGYVGPVTIFDQGEPLNAGLHADGRRSPTAPHLEEYLACSDVTSVVMSDLARSRFEALLHEAGLSPVYEGGGVSVWRPSGSPSIGGTGTPGTCSTNAGAAP